MSFNYSPRIITDGLVLYLDAANTRSYPGSGTTWNDLSRSGNNGTLTNGPTFSSANGGSIVFDGSNDYVNLGNPTSLNILNFTVCIWCKSSTFTNFQNIIFKGTNIAQYGILFTSTGDWYVQPNGPSTSDLVSLNTWNYFVGTYDGSQITAYRNGVQKIQYVNSQANYGTLVTIGADTVNNRYFNGNIAQTQIYNRALSATEILQNYNATKTRFGL